VGRLFAAPENSFWLPRKGIVKARYGVLLSALPVLQLSTK
jgi:hypothetical protein